MTMHETLPYDELANSRSTVIKCMKIATTQHPSLELTATWVITKQRKLFPVRTGTASRKKVTYSSHVGVRTVELVRRATLPLGVGKGRLRDYIRSNLNGEFQIL